MPAEAMLHVWLEWEMDGCRRSPSCARSGSLSRWCPSCRRKNRCTRASLPGHAQLTHTRSHTQLYALSYEDKHVVADGKRALNLLSHNFLNLANTPEMLVRRELQLLGCLCAGACLLLGMDVDIHAKMLACVQGAQGGA
eukprot:1159014-Pelagomonas_calceolata.AAC.10